MYASDGEIYKLVMVGGLLERPQTVLDKPETYPSDDTALSR